MMHDFSESARHNKPDAGNARSSVVVFIKSSPRVPDPGRSTHSAKRFGLPSESEQSPLQRLGGAYGFARHDMRVMDAPVRFEAVAW